MCNYKYSNTAWETETGNQLPFLYLKILERVARNQGYRVLELQRATFLNKKIGDYLKIFSWFRNISIKF